MACLLLLWSRNPVLETIHAKMKSASLGVHRVICECDDQYTHGAEVARQTGLQQRPDSRV